MHLIRFYPCNPWLLFLVLRHAPMRPLVSSNSSPPHTTVCDAKLHAQKTSPKQSRIGSSHRSRSTCSSRSTPTPTESATDTRASSTRLSRVKLHSAKPEAMQLSAAHGMQ